MLVLLDRGLRTQQIEVVKDLAPELPRIHARRQDVEQLLLQPPEQREGQHAGRRPPDDPRLGGAGRRDRIGPDLDRRHRPRDPAAILPRVFEPFFTTKKDGTGLGLDICRSIVWEYDGALWLDSKEGAGTVAQIRLPVRRPWAAIEGLTEAGRATGRTEATAREDRATLAAAASSRRSRKPRQDHGQ